jgi:molybdopterin-containing oxidoreductase family iron-sulfur binding subunit
MSTTPGNADPGLELSGLRRRLADSTGRIYWKSLEELARAPQFLEFLHREFPEQAATFDDPDGRRGFLKMMGASLALAGLTGCTRQPEEKIVPYVKPPEEVVPGRPLFFATAVTDGGYAKGVLVESHMGRPTKVEGNPDHPASLGATDVFGQASVLDLYDPDRSQTLTYLGEIRPWGSFLAAVKAALDGQRATQGGGLRILSDTVTSPTLAACSRIAPSCSKRAGSLSARAATRPRRWIVPGQRVQAEAKSPLTVFVRSGPSVTHSSRSL